MPKRTSNPKRALRPPPETAEDVQWLQWLSSKIGYGGNPMHKKNPGDFGLDPPGLGRQDKTLCDVAKVFSKTEALRLLRNGARYGLVSVDMDGDWPKNIWAVAQNGEAVEAILENKGLGTYHGYAMGEHDPLAEKVRMRWEVACRQNS